VSVLKDNTFDNYLIENFCPRNQHSYDERSCLVAFCEYVTVGGVICSFFAVFVSFSCIALYFFFLSALVVTNKGIRSLCQYT